MTNTGVMSETIRQARKERGITLARLAEMTGLSESYIWRIEAGQRHPGPDTVAKLAQALELDPEELGATVNDGGTHSSVTQVLDVSTAIWNDPGLTQEAKGVLLAVYRQLRG